MWIATRRMRARWTGGGKRFEAAAGAVRAVVEEGD